MTKEEVEEEEVSRPTGSKKSPVVALVRSLGVPIFLAFMAGATGAIGEAIDNGAVNLIAGVLALFGLLDGWGQFYNGEVGKGFWFLGLGLGFYALIFAIGYWGYGDWGG